MERRLELLSRRSCPGFMIFRCCREEYSEGTIFSVLKLIDILFFFLFFFGLCVQCDTSDEKALKNVFPFCFFFVSLHVDVVGLLMALSQTGLLYSIHGGFSYGR